MEREGNTHTCQTNHTKYAHTAQTSTCCSYSTIGAIIRARRINKTSNEIVIIVYFHFFNGAQNKTF